LAILVTVADSKDGVVEGGSTFGVVEDTAFVELEAELVSLNCDGDGPYGEGTLEFGDGADGDFSEVGDSDGELISGVVGAGTVKGSVFVVLFTNGAISLVVFESRCLPATAATVA
jgi:hypothetical protein